MADRGNYRAIARVLLDGPDFQELPERANHAFLILKIMFGPSGIEVHYPEALAHEVAEKTRMPLDAAREALDVLEQGGWIMRERNLVWIVGQLEFDPHMAVDDRKHRESVWRHIAGLPRLELVRRFVHHYRAWFDELHTTWKSNTKDGEHKKGDPRVVEGAPEALRQLLSRPIAGPTQGPDIGPDQGLPKAHRSTETETETEDRDREPKTETPDVASSPASDSRAHTREGTPQPRWMVSTDLAEIVAGFAASNVDEPAREVFIADAKGITTNLDLEVWRDRTGQYAPEERRPDLLRLALMRWEARAGLLRTHVRYIVAQQMTPYQAGATPQEEDEDLILGACRLMLTLGGGLLRSASDREMGFDRIRAKDPDLWERYGDVFRKLRFPPLLDAKDDHARTRILREQLRLIRGGADA